MGDYNAAVDMVDRNVAEGRGDHAAFIDPTRRLTYGELRQQCARIGPMLARLGLRREDRFAMIMLDTVDFPVLFWGAIRAGIVPIPLNTLLTAEQYRYILADARVSVLFVSAPLKQTGRVMVKDEDLCVHCGLCAERCPTAAWDMQKSQVVIPYAVDEAR